MTQPESPAATSARTRRSLEQHLAADGAPKRILALDGGGVRGMLSLQVLRRIESLLRKRSGKPDLRLSDYFDLVGGTSTGAIIAAALALGKSVDEIEALYEELASQIFRKPWFRIGAFVPKFGRETLIEALQKSFGAAVKLGSPELETGLLVVSKRMDTGSSWVLTNSPRDPYYAPVAGKKRIGNCNMLLWQVVRASTAAPHYFKPERLVVGSWTDPSNGELVVDRGEFVDGGVSPANNPSLQCLRAALIGAYGLHWQADPERLLLVSVGTGLARKGRGHASGWQRLAGVYAFNALRSLMEDCNTEVELTLQWLSESPTARRLDGLVQRLDGELLAGRPLLSYRRYNLAFDEKLLPPALAGRYAQAELDDLAQMDRPANMARLKELGARVADAVQPEHFPAAFDL